MVFDAESYVKGLFNWSLSIIECSYKMMKKEKTITNDVDENPKAKYILEELLEDINENNIYAEVDFGEPVGKEIID